MVAEMVESGAYKAMAENQTVRDNPYHSDGIKAMRCLKTAFYAAVVGTFLTGIHHQNMHYEKNNPNESPPAWHDQLFVPISDVIDGICDYQIEDSK